MVGKRKYESGSSKRKKKERRDKLTQSMSGSMDRYVKPTAPAFEVKNLVIDTAMNTNGNVIIDSCPVLNEKVNAKKNLKPMSADEELTANALVDDEKLNPVIADEILTRNMIVTDELLLNDNPVGDENGENDNKMTRMEKVKDDKILDISGEKVYDPFDPGNWEKSMFQRKVNLLVEKGPIRVKDVVYPANGKNRRFSDTHYSRSLLSGDRLDRPWLVYSRKKDKVFCFCCVLFKRCVPSPLTTATMGYNDWHNMHTRLTEHERGSGHISSLTDWMEAETRLRKNLTIDLLNQKANNKEK